MEPPRATGPSELLAGGTGVTLVVARRAKPGCEAKLEHWTSDVIAAASSFPGYLGATVLRTGPTRSEHTLVVRYASYDDLCGWQGSAECRGWIAKAEPLVVGAARTWAQTGLETWFALPGLAGAGPPPAWKMALLTWAVISPLIVVTGALLGPSLAGWPVLVRTAVSAALIVSVMTWVVMPRVTRRFAGWLYPGR